MHLLKFNLRGQYKRRTKSRLNDNDGVDFLGRIVQSLVISFNEEFPKRHDHVLSKSYEVSCHTFE